jgi:hypothetical protein
MQMFLDDLPIWGFVGKVEKILHAGEKSLYKYYLFTHIHFEIRYNGGMQGSWHLDIRLPSLSSQTRRSPSVSPHTAAGQCANDFLSLCCPHHAQVTR